MPFQRLLIDPTTGFRYDAMYAGKPFDSSALTVGQTAFAKNYLENNLAVHRMPLVEVIEIDHTRAPIAAVFYSTKQIVEALKLLSVYRILVNRPHARPDVEVVGWIKIPPIRSRQDNRQPDTFTPLVIIRDRPDVIQKMDQFFNPIIDRYRKEHYG